MQMDFKSKPMELEGDDSNEVLDKITKLEKKIESLEKKTVALGSNCHQAFLQIREAMHTLREELGEAAGVIIADTWNT